jgi:hypothetical protein
MTSVMLVYIHRVRFNDEQHMLYAHTKSYMKAVYLLSMATSCHLIQ